MNQISRRRTSIAFNHTLPFHLHPPHLPRLHPPPLYRRSTTRPPQQDPPSSCKALMAPRIGLKAQSAHLEAKTCGPRVYLTRPPRSIPFRTLIFRIQRQDRESTERRRRARPIARPRAQAITSRIYPPLQETRSFLGGTIGTSPAICMPLIMHASRAGGGLHSLGLEGAARIRSSSLCTHTRILTRTRLHTLTLTHTHTTLRTPLCQLNLCNMTRIPSSAAAARNRRCRRSPRRRARASTSTPMGGVEADTTDMRTWTWRGGCTESTAGAQTALRATATGTCTTTASTRSAAGLPRPRTTQRRRSGAEDRSSESWRVSRIPQPARSVLTRVRICTDAGPPTGHHDPLARHRAHSVHHDGLRVQYVYVAPFPLSSPRRSLPTHAHARAPASLVIAIVFHQLFEGLSLGIRIAGLPSSDSERTSPASAARVRTYLHPSLLSHTDGFSPLPGRTLKPFLAVTFATTTPLGIGIGLAALGGAGKSKGRASPSPVSPRVSIH